MITLKDVREYLKIDYNEEDAYLQNLIEISEIFIDSCVGTNYKTDEKMVKLAELLQKKIINEMYENRSTTVTNDKQDIIVMSILNILALKGDTNE